MNNELNIHSKTVDGHYLITLSGSIGSGSAEDLSRELQTAFSGHHYNIILDLEQVNLITSSGLRVMLTTVKTCQQNGGNLKLIHVSKSLKEIFNIIGISFDIFDDLSAALNK